MTKIYAKRVSLGTFFKKGIDFTDGDLLTIASEGKQVDGQYGSQDIFLVKLQDEKEGNVSFNSTTINGLIDAYGKDATHWIGKQIKATKVKQNVAGKFIDVWYFAHPKAELTEDGFVLPTKDQNKAELPREEGPPVEAIEAYKDEIRGSDIPF